ncbi:MAG: universal stress protein [Halobacteriaceae archaeon]
MTLVVPFDGSDLSAAALRRAAAFRTVFEKRVLAVSVIPAGNADYARERGWLGPAERYDLSDVVATLRQQVQSHCPSADFRHETVDRNSPTGTISNRLRRIAREADASMVFVGSENAGRVVRSLSSVGASVASDDTYDVVIVRHTNPSTLVGRRDVDRE